MDVYTSRPTKVVDKKFFNSQIRKPIVIHSHALDHLEEGQRKIFKEEELLHMLNKENPRKVYLQKNGRYAAFYRRSDGYRKLVIDIEKRRSVIVSFMDMLEIPKYKL